MGTVAVQAPKEPFIGEIPNKYPRYIRCICRVDHAGYLHPKGFTTIFPMIDTKVEIHPRKLTWMPKMMGLGKGDTGFKYGHFWYVKLLRCSSYFQSIYIYICIYIYMLSHGPVCATRSFVTCFDKQLVTDVCIWHEKCHAVSWCSVVWYQTLSFLANGIELLLVQCWLNKNRLLIIFVELKATHLNKLFQPQSCLKQ